MKNILDELYDYDLFHLTEIEDMDGSYKTALDRLEIDELGLDQNDRRMLDAMIRYYRGGPVGLETLAAAIGEEAVTIEDVYEPYLMQIGFLSRTPRGRCVTAEACRHLGYDFPKGAVQGSATQPNLFDN